MLCLSFIYAVVVVVVVFHYVELVFNYIEVVFHYVVVVLITSLHV